MKKLVSMLLAVSMIFSLFAFNVAAAEEEAEEILSVSFDEKPLGDFTWRVSNASEESPVTIQEDTDGRKYLDIVDNNAKSSVAITIPVTLDETCTISFDYKMFEGSAAGMNFFVQSSDFPPLLAAYLSEEMRVFNASSQKKTGATIPFGKWMTVTAVLDTEQRCSSVYIDGVLVADKYAFRHEEESVGKQLHLGGDNGSVTSHMGLRDIKIVKGEVIPEKKENPAVSMPEASTNATTSSGPDASKVKTAEIIPSFDNAKADLDAKFGNALALFIDYPMSRKGNDYVLVDSSNTDVRPFIVDGRTLVPVRFISESFGATVGWDDATRKVTVDIDGKHIELVLGDTNMKVGNETVVLDVPANSYDGRTFIPLRAMVESIGKKVFWDDRGLIIISDGNTITENDETLIKYLISQIKDKTDAVTRSQYSKVYMSSRWYRKDGRDDQWGTLDAIKRFMATGDKWSYISPKEEIQSITDMGITFQAAINATAGIEGVTEAISIDGSIAQAPWMSWKHMWGCATKPEYRQFIKDQVKEYIDNGVTSIQIDDVTLNYIAANWGACFCDYCMVGFRNYLKENYQDKLAEFGITDIDNFNYKTYLAEKGITERLQYTKAGVALPIHKAFKKYGAYTTREYLIEIKNYMDEYAGTPIVFTGNSKGYSEEFDGDTTFIHEVLDGTMGETTQDSSAAEDIFISSYIDKALGKEFILSPIPANDNAMEVIRSAIAMSYATGQFLLVPWDTFIGDADRYFATTEELEGLYWFVRQYPELFDDYEAYEKIGYIHNLNNETSESLREKVDNIFRSATPARALISHSANNIAIGEKNVQGLDYIVGDISTLTQAEQDIINASGAQLVADDSGIKDSYKVATIQGNPEGLYTVLRTNTVHENAPKVLHVVSYTRETTPEVKVDISNQYVFGDKAVAATVYEPGKNPVSVPVVNENGKVTVTLNNVGRWAVVKLESDETVARGKYVLGGGYSGISLGTRQSEDKVAGTTDNLLMVSYGSGLNVRTQADTTGCQDEGAYVYKYIDAGKSRQYFASAKFEEISGTAGIMLRENPTSSARFIGLFYDAKNGLRLAKREKINKDVTFEKVSDTKPTYMKVGRVGDKIVAAISEDGVNYTEVGTFEDTIINPLAGVFASSADTKRSVATVKDINVTDGVYGIKEIKSFAIETKTVYTKDKNLVLDVNLETDMHKNLGVGDAEMTFTSSDESILKIRDNGVLVPLAEGVVTVKVVAQMDGFVKEAVEQIVVAKADPTIYKENFDGKTRIPSVAQVGHGDITVDGEKLIVRAKASGGTADINFNIPELASDVVFEFDFKAEFDDEKSGGARVLYVDGMGIGLTAADGKFCNHFGSDLKSYTTMEEGKWYHFKVVVRYSDFTIDIYIDGEKLVESAPFRTELSPTGIFQFGGYSLGMGDVFEWDNLWVYNLD